MALSKTNVQLMVEQGRLREAMEQVEVTQKKLLESEHRRSEATRRNMEKLLAQIIEGDPVPTLVINARHHITHWNRACALISGHSAQDMVGTNKHWQAFYPDARPLMADLLVDGCTEAEFERYYGHLYRRSKIIEGAFEGEAFFPHVGQGRWLLLPQHPCTMTTGS
jgi:PAS domain-containing protein